MSQDLKYTWHSLNPTPTTLYKIHTKNQYLLNKY
jgi:hypothetical protein